jgi:hypothetical protein
MPWSESEQVELRAYAEALGADICVRLDFDEEGNWITVRTTKGGDHPLDCSGIIDPPNLLQAKLAIKREIALARSRLQAGR